MQIATMVALLYAGVVLFLTVPTASQEQCVLPTNGDVESVANDIYADLAAGGNTPQTVQDLFQVNFTCLATVALDMFAYATVVANFTTTSSSENITQQFQLMCEGGAWVKSTLSGFKDPANLPGMPFDIETQFECSNCEYIPGSGDNSTYDSDSNCFFCASECLDIGGGFCTGNTPSDCCPFFNSDTGACVDNCTMIDPNLAPDENFACVCNISCDPGYTLNTTYCICEFTDGCEAAGQPCQNGGTCISNTSAPVGGPYYTCVCANGFFGENCSTVIFTFSLSSGNMATAPTFIPTGVSSTIVATTISIATSATPITPIEDPPYWIIAAVVVPLLVITALAITIAIVLFIVRRRRIKSVVLMEMK